MTRAKDIAGTAKLYRKLAERGGGGGGGEAKVAPPFLPFFQTHPPCSSPPPGSSHSPTRTQEEGTKYSARGQVNRARKSALHSTRQSWGARRASPRARNNTPRSIRKNNIFIPSSSPSDPSNSAGRSAGFYFLRRHDVFFDSRLVFYLIFACPKQYKREIRERSSIFLRNYYSFYILK